MSSNLTGIQGEYEWVDALSDFFASPSADVPPEVLEAFAVIQNHGQVLPPRLFYEVVEQSSIAISITDNQANILYVNRAFQNLTGYCSDELWGENESILSYKATPKTVYRELWSTILSGQAWNGMLVNKRKDGSRYLAEVTVAPISCDRAESHYFLGMHRDVTALHNLKNKVHNQKELIESVVDHAPMAIALLDMTGRVVLDNRAYKTLMADLGGREPAELILQSANSTISEDFETACARGYGFEHQEVRLFQGLGREARWFSCSANWIKEFDLQAESYFKPDTQNGLLLVANEITRQKREQEQARINAVQALMMEQSATLNMQETLSGAIFQMQGPLNMIEAAAEMLKRQEPGQEHLYHTLKQALDAGHQAVETLRSSIPGEVSEATGPVNINDVVRDVLNVMAERLLAEGVVVDCRPTESLPFITGQAGKLRALVKYLLDNAIDALREPGDWQREFMIMTKNNNDERIELWVQDMGPGLATELRFKAFEPFFSNWNARRGHSGMGLTMAQQIAVEYGGEVEVDTEYSNGCRVRVSIPVDGGQQ
ncbi:MAG TPA: nitrogen fixation negative regulator NifL [Gammaproteobacteria bacterium]|nr:nitrogen fixation negative regulator NifL [Gammaproteobacteria bacterium]